MIKTMFDSERDAALMVADLMVAAATTAPQRHPLPASSQPHSNISGD